MTDVKETKISAETIQLKQKNKTDPVVSVSVFRHPVYTDYGSSDDGHIYNMRLKKEIAVKPVKLMQKKQNGENCTQYKFTLRKDNQSTGMCVPRFVYECCKGKVLDRYMRVYKLNGDDNGIDNLKISGDKASYITKISKKIEDLKKAYQEACKSDT